MTDQEILRLIESGRYFTTSGTNTYTATSASTMPPVQNYSSRKSYYLNVAIANTGICTINIDGAGPVNIVKSGNLPLASGDLKSGTIVEIVYDGTNFQIVGGISLGLSLPVISNVPKSIQTKIIAQNYDGTVYKVDGNVVAKLIAGNNFSPKDLAGLVGWWDFTDQSTITFAPVSGTDYISQINDKSGAGNNLIQATQANKPVCNHYGGQNDFGFGGFSSSVLNLANASFAYTMPYTLFMVFRMTTYGGQAINFQSGTNGVTSYGWTFDDFVAQAFGPVSNSNYQRFHFNFTGDCVIVGWTFDGTNGNNRVYNGFVGEIVNKVIENSGTAATVKMQIGGGTLMEMYEVLFFNGRLKNSDLLKVDNYLHAKYEIPEKIQFFAFGDSITVGFNSSSTMAGYVQRVAKYKGLQAVTIAVSGTTLINHMRPNYTQYLRSIPKNSYIGIAYGSNEAGIDAAWNTCLITIIQNLIAAGFMPARILLITPPYSSARVTRLTAEQGYFAAAAANYGVTYVDCITPTLAAGGDSLITDGTHPGDPGHEIMAQTIIALM